MRFAPRVKLDSKQVTDRRKFDRPGGGDLVTPRILLQQAAAYIGHVVSTSARPRRPQPPPPSRRSSTYNGHH